MTNTMRHSGIPWIGDIPSHWEAEHFDSASPLSLCPCVRASALPFSLPNPLTLTTKKSNKITKLLLFRQKSSTFVALFCGYAAMPQGREFLRRCTSDY